MQKQIYNLEAKFNDAGSGSFEGYASTFGNWDRVGERPVKGAFSKHLPDFLKDGFFAIGHDWYSLPIAYPTKAYEDEHGLYFAADFHSTEQAQAARMVMRERAEAGKANKLSIGYDVVQFENKAEGRELTELKLWEISYVTIPANNEANVTASKGLTLDEHTSELQAQLKYWQNRLAEIAALRIEQQKMQKAGAVFSQQNVQRMAAIHSSLKELVGELEKLMALADPKGMDSEQVKAALELLQITYKLGI